MKKWSRFTIILVAVLLLAYFGVGGGCGTKTNSSRLNLRTAALFAHRAKGTTVYPENSIEGIGESLALGYDGVEIDVRTTKDDVFVLFHDDSCQRLLRLAEPMNGKLFAEVKDIPMWEHSRTGIAKLARLDTVLARYGDSLLFYLDVKVTGLDQADSLARLVQRFAPQENVLIASSSIPFITTLEYRHPELNTVLEGFDKGEEWTWWLFPKNFRPDFVSSFAFEVDEDHVAWLREQGLLANKIVYGVDSPGYARMNASGITRFIVDPGIPR